MQVMRNLVTIFTLILLSFVISGCDETELYSNLPEKDASEMQAILLGHGINCDKTIDKENKCNILISKKHLPEAVDLLNSFGYPREEYTDMGAMFKKEGLISSPMEERVRFIYALSQEVSKTISQIDGVISSRVHIVLPENDPLSQYFQPSSASVFIKYRQNYDFPNYIHQIKKLVVNSIEGLNYEKVSVFTFPSAVPTVEKKQNVRMMGIEIDSRYRYRFKLLFFGLGLFLLLSVCTSAVLFRKLQAISK